MTYQFFDFSIFTYLLLYFTRVISLGKNHFTFLFIKFISNPLFVLFVIGSISLTTILNTSKPLVQPVTRPLQFVVQLPDSVAVYLIVSRLDVELLLAELDGLVEVYFVDQRLGHVDNWELLLPNSFEYRCHAFTSRYS